jgi:hypothetical protein
LEPVNARSAVSADLGFDDPSVKGSSAVFAVAEVFEPC